LKKYLIISEIINNILNRDSLEELSPEDRKKLFSEELLRELPLEIYLKLWKLGSPYYVSHVTRQ
jgi:hypothetical protein